MRRNCVVPVKCLVEREHKTPCGWRLGVEKQRVRVTGLSAADTWGLVRVGGRGNRALRLEDKRGEWQRTWLTVQGAEGELSLLTKSAGSD